jgi:hypothetical protein
MKSVWTLRSYTPDTFGVAHQWWSHPARHPGSPRLAASLVEHAVELSRSRVSLVSLTHKFAPPSGRVVPTYTFMVPVRVSREARGLGTPPACCV